MRYRNDYYDARTVANAPDQVRVEFIKAVYRIFAVSMAVTVGVGWLCAQPTVLPAIAPMIGVVAIVALVVGVVMAFAQRVQGLNLALLLLYSALQGAVIGPVLMMVESASPGLGVDAALLTLAVFGGLTFYTFASGKDFSFLGGFLWMAVIGLLFAGLLMFFFPSGIGSLLYSVAGVLIFSGYILYDTSNIIRRLGREDTVAGAIALYLDIVALFWFILRLLQQTRD